jgi:hypothetical protein
MRSIPRTWQELADLGYVFDNESCCKGCGAQIEWWITPKGNKMPMSIVEKKDGVGFFAKTVGFLRVAHFVDCPNAKDFRKGRKR